MGFVMHLLITIWIGIVPFLATSALGLLHSAAGDESIRPLLLLPQFMVRMSNSNKQIGEAITSADKEPILRIEDTDEGGEPAQQQSSKVFMRRPCYFSPVQCLLRTPGQHQVFQNHPQFGNNHLRANPFHRRLSLSLLPNPAEHDQPFTITHLQRRGLRSRAAKNLLINEQTGNGEGGVAGPSADEHRHYMGVQSVRAFSKITQQQLSNSPWNIFG